MNFHYTASDTEVVQRVEDGHHILKAKLQKTDSGAYEDAELDLDTILGNNEGKAHDSIADLRWSICVLSYD